MESKKIASKSDVEKTFGHRLRVRVCGLLIENDSVLIAKHLSIGKRGVFYAPPGGGLEYGESVEDALKREFLEETGLEITIKEFMFTHEFFDLPLHGIELFFLVERKSGKLITGVDPEMENGKQTIDNMSFIDFNTLQELHVEEKHHLFRHCNSLNDLIKMKGFYSNLKENS
ncbi:NUDIX domain-containing protein [Flammeovirga pectinis]|uniref:NUDIX domain-containing protein n=1 Tax=Flammeovirga pectinis TaxID=2494373 RepID=A0A3Q9FQ83_9BACT|nr:NUDIX domain-containing protein [Flammeovirga pectinis]AZQ62252.1 NUDIX domain-containing protein [Flammeovirga pectinis]